MYKNASDADKEKYKAQLFDQQFFKLASKRMNEEENIRIKNKKFYNPNEDQISVAKDKVQISSTKYLPSPKNAIKGYHHTLPALDTPGVGEHEVK